MRRRSKKDGQPTKPRAARTAASKRSQPSKSARHDNPSGDSQKEITKLTRERDEALEQLAATSEVLRIISSSPGELRPIFNAMIELATRLCGAKVGTLAMYEEGRFWGAAVYGHSKRYADSLSRFGAVPGTGLTQMQETLRAVQVSDVLAEAAYDAIRRDNPDYGRNRTALYVPIIKERDLIGAFMIYRHEVRVFTEKQIKLVQNFAAQAVIVIENTRLLDDLNKLNQQLEQRVTDQVGEIERMGRLRRFLPPQVADLIVASGTEKQLESHRREITALFCDLRGFTGFSESSDPEDVMALLREYHAAIGGIINKYGGTLERYAGDGVMVVFNDPIPVNNPGPPSRTDGN